MKQYELTIAKSRYFITILQDMDEILTIGPKHNYYDPVNATLVWGRCWE